MDNQGGTSSAAPLWAGMLADINASATCATQSATANGVGFASPLLYAVASVPSQYAASFNDITVGNNDIYGLDNGKVFPATKGYDLTTGLGTPELTGPGGTPAWRSISVAPRRRPLGRWFQTCRQDRAAPAAVRR